MVPRGVIQGVGSVVWHAFDFGCKINDYAVGYLEFNYYSVFPYIVGPRSGLN